MSRKKFTDEEYLELYEKGLNDREAAEVLGVWKSTVGRRRRKLDLEPNSGPREKWTKELIIERLKNLEDKLDRSPSSQDAVKRGLTGLVSAAQREFGSWNDAKKAVGLKTFPPVGDPKDLTYLKAFEIVEREEVIAMSELPEKVDRSRETVLRWIMKLKKETDLKKYQPVLRARGSVRYRTKDFFKRHDQRTYLYISPIKFAQFFEEELLEFDLDKDLDKGLKHALTEHIKKKLPAEAVTYLRKKYVKESRHSKLKDIRR